MSFLISPTRSPLTIIKSSALTNQGPDNNANNKAKRNLFIKKPTLPNRKRFEKRFWNPNVDHFQFTHEIFGFGLDQALFDASECDRHIGQDGRMRIGSFIAIETRWNIRRNDLHFGVVI